MDDLVFPEDARLPEHGVHQGGLAMVHVGDDGDVANILLHRVFILFKSYPYGKACALCSGAGSMSRGKGRDS
jgi:hypothetical protein